ncbi:hypothetical protein BO94DRAFT_573462 [Aspergillus sclerotioniger CBS 115572]|uniref:BRCT domain-containing protein n=1 Tax=Aspergillus sclerotioniger CBS 115572 TaxID=1450535 RepID=A0A317X3W5_9EURO|nr:hypothetical protein BO94DRAFT_573462 [Aspergillus sclerotioniger CBS 115572]PWY93324.1 hypothetical protein BO94DRAFT_573462 [Aspergillus sclerotioniger CBS 115572]
MPPPRIPNSILPQNHLTFDVWNTSSTGHQVADSAQGTAWRDTRREKLTRQFGEGKGDCTLYQSGDSGDGRGEWVVDSSASYSSREKAVILKKEERDRKDARQMDIRGMFGAIGFKFDVYVYFYTTFGFDNIIAKAVAKAVTVPIGASCADTYTYTYPCTCAHAYIHIHTHIHIYIYIYICIYIISINTNTKTYTYTYIRIHIYIDTYTHAYISIYLPTTTYTYPTNPSLNPPRTTTITTTSSSTKPTPQVLTNLTIHINGQTAPHISDHKLKHLLITHGADLALHLHRKVTHVIICQPNSGPGRGTGSGSGFAAGKLQREIQRGGWKGIKIVGVEWVLDSIEAGKRLSETRYAVNLRTNQKSVFGYLTSSSSSPSTSKSTSI